MSDIFRSFWQANIELSLLLLAVLVARYAIRRTTKVYNAYILWLSIPIGLILAKVVSLIEFSKPPVEVVAYAVNNYIVQSADAFDGWAALGAIWALVALLLLLRLLRQHIHLRKELSAIRVSNKTSYCSVYPVIDIDKEDFSPAVYGFLKPKIYFPAQLYNELSAEQIALIIRHEEHHIKQKHLWLNLLWDILVCLFWFNPLVYLSRQGFRHDQELFCDYLVLNKSTQRDHKTYGHALLSTVSATHSVSLLCSWKTFNQLEERIMNIKKSTSLSARISIAVLAAMIVACTSIYTVSAAQYEEKKVIIESEWPMTKQEERVFRKSIRNSEREVGDTRRSLEKTIVEFEDEHERDSAKHQREAERHARMRKSEQSKREVAEEKRALARASQSLKIREQKLKAKNGVFIQYEKELDKAQRIVADSQRELDESYREGEMSIEEAERLRENLSSVQHDLAQQKLELQRYIANKRTEVAREKSKLARQQAQLRSKIDKPRKPRRVEAAPTPIEPVKPMRAI